MNKNNYIHPLFFSAASSCLTNQDLLLADVTTVSLSLKDLLLRPGKDFLYAQNIRNYFAWNQRLVLNCASLELNSKGEFKIISEVDGSKYIFSKNDIFTLIESLDVDVIIHPVVNYSDSKNFVTDSGENRIFFDAKDKNDKNINYKYLMGAFSLNDLLTLRQQSNLYIENHKSFADGYVGVFYKDMQEFSILDSTLEFDFSVLDKNCHCYTCSSGYTCAYLHHLLKNTPLLAQRLLILHNVFYINHLP